MYGRHGSGYESDHDDPSESEDETQPNPDTFTLEPGEIATTREGIWTPTEWVEEKRVNRRGAWYHTDYFEERHIAWRKHWAASWDKETRGETSFYRPTIDLAAIQSVLDCAIDCAIELGDQLLDLLLCTALREPGLVELVTDYLDDDLVHPGY